MDHFLERAERYAQEAHRLRVLALQERDFLARRQLEQIADQYEKLAVKYRDVRKREREPTA
jgi:hypothetical protein